MIIFKNVYLLNKNADPTVVGMDSYEEPLEMADLSDLEIDVIDTALEEAGIEAEDLIDYENLRIININALKTIIEEASTCFRF